MSEIIDPTDRTISFLLGDGAGAAVIGPADVPMISTSTWGADGSGWELVGKNHSWTDWRDHRELGWPTLRQEGPSVFKWAVFTVTKYAKQAIAAAGLEPADIDVFIPHQANLRIIEKMAQYLSLREDVVIARDIVTTGNTSAASIPLATAALRESGAYEPGAIGLQIGFGAGLTHAAQVVVLP